MHMAMLAEANQGESPAGEEKPFATFETKKEASIRLQECQTTGKSFVPAKCVLMHD